MLEAEEILKTWRIPNPPDQSPQTIEQIQDHRMIYLQYEGEISGNRGYVKIWDKGEYVTRTWSAQLIAIQLSGERLKGNYYIKLFESKKWIFEKSGAKTKT